MKSRKKIILILACVMVTALSALVISSCSLNRLTIDDLVDMGYDYTVTFDLQGGTANSNGYLYVQVAAGSYLPEPGSVGSTGSVVYPAPTKSGYTLSGYYRGTEDEDGNVTYGEQWNFETDTVNSDLTLYAVWQENYKLVLYYGEDLSLSKEVSLTLSADGVFSSVASTAIRTSGYTVLGYYLNDDFTEQITFPYTPTLSQFEGDSIVLNVYANTLTGTYTLVDEPSDLITFYNGTNVYMLNDVDMTGVTVTFPDAYSGSFVGNGYTISNLTITQAASRTYSNYGLFRQIISGGSISDVTFENLTVNVTLDNPSISSYTVGLLAGSILSGASLTNVTVTGTLNISYITDVEEKIEYGTLAGSINDSAVLENCIYSEIVCNYVNSDEQTSE